MAVRCLIDVRVGVDWVKTVIKDRGSYRTGSWASSCSADIKMNDLYKHKNIKLGNFLSTPRVNSPIV